MTQDDKTGKRDARRGAFVALAAFSVLAMWSVAATAARPVRVYEIAVKNADSPDVVEDAMRRALVRITGKRGAGSDPALSGIVANAPKYVQARRPLSAGITTLVFDGPTLQRDIIAVGRSIWKSERPFTIVVLDPPVTGAAADAARRTAESIAETRGLPVSLIPMTMVDANGVELSPDMLLQSAQRSGGDAVLLGRGESAALNGQWQWTLQTNIGAENFSGSFEAGIQGAADALARSQDETVSLAEIDAVVEVDGVNSLADYAAVSRLLGDLPGVKRASIEETDGGIATFRLTVRGGPDVVERALANSARFTRMGAGSARLAYQYRP